MYKYCELLAAWKREADEIFWSELLADGYDEYLAEQEEKWLASTTGNLDAYSPGSELADRNNKEIKF